MVITASDGTLSDSRTFAWTVTNVNRAPVLTALAGRTDAEDATLSLPVAASDPDGDTLTYSATGLPEGLAIGPTTGVISGTLSYVSAGTHPVTVTAADTELATVSTSFTWMVTDVNRPPVLTAVADQASAENATIALPLAANDPDGTALTFSATGLPSGLAIHPGTGAIAGTLAYDSAGPHTVVITASDGTLSDSRTFAWTVTNVNQPPTLTDVPDRTDPENTGVTIPLAGADLDPGTTLTYSAAPLPAGVTINPATGLIAGTLSYASAGIHTVTVSVSDGTASADQTFAWTVTNVNRPPTLTDVPDRTDPEDTVVAIPLAGVDLDAGTTLTYSAAPLPAGITINQATGLISGTLTYASAGNSTVTVSVSDGTAAAEQTFTWTVTNVNQLPTLTDVSDRTDPENTVVAIPLAGVDLDPGTTLTYSAAPLPAGITVNVATGLISGTLTYASAGSSTVTVSVSDGTASADQTFTWTVTNVNQPPTLTDVPDRTDPENTVVAIPLAGADLDAGTTLTYSAAPLPAGVTINPATGAITGTLSYTSAGTHAVTVTVSDGTLTASQSVTWTVTDVNRAPLLTVAANQTSAENTTVALPLVASDPDGDALTFSATGLPSGLTIHPGTGAIAGTLAYDSAGPHTVVITASDGTLSDSRTFAWTVTNVNRTPVLTAIADRTDVENATISLPVVASDPDGDTLTYSATGLPSGLAIHPTTGAITGTLAYTSAGTHPVTVTAIDPDFATGSQTFTWTVTNVNQAPVLTALAGRTDAENATVSLSVAATDPDGDTLTFSATGLPEGLTIGSTTGVISGTLSYASAGAHPVTVTATDTASATGSQTFTWTVTNVNQAPVLTGAVGRTDAENATVSLPLAATDPDADALTYSATGLPAGLTIDATTGVISGTLSYTSAGTYNVSATVSDDAVSTSQSFTWIVTDVNGAPVVTAVADQTSAEDTTVMLPLVASDPDGDALTYSATGLPGGLTIHATTGLISGTLSYTSAGTYPVTVTATDTATATGSQMFTWTVTDVNRSPMLTAIADRTDAENATVTLTLVANDPDGTALTYSATGLPEGLTIQPTTGVISGTLSYTSTGTHAVTVTATDPALGTGSTTFTWTVTDVNRAPALTALGPLSTTTELSVSLPLVASDPDSDPVTYDATGLPPGVSVDAGTGLIAGTPSSPGVYTVTAFATDSSLSTSQSFDWMVETKPAGRVKFIQATSAAPHPPQGTVTVRYPAAQSAGHLNVVVVGWRDATAQVQAVTDTTGNLYQLAVGPTVAAGVGTQAIYYAANVAAATAGGNAVTVTFTAPPTLPDIRVAAYAGIDPVNPVDVTAVAQGTGATLDSGTGQTTFADDLLIGASLVAAPATTAPGAGYTARLLSSAGNLLEDRIVATVDSYRATAALSPSGAWIMQMVAFRDPNRAPTLTSPGPQFSTEHESIWVALAGSDPDDEPIDVQRQRTAGLRDRQRRHRRDLRDAVGHECGELHGHRDRVRRLT